MQSEKVQQQLTEGKLQTIFQKPSKNRKREPQIPKESTTENTMVDMVVRGELDDATPVQNSKGTKIIAEWFLWSQANLQAKKKSKLIKIGQKYKMKNAAPHQRKNNW